jgi:uncharacterized membrane protein
MRRSLTAAAVVVGSVGAFALVRAARRDVTANRSSVARSATIRRDPEALYAMLQDVQLLPRFVRGLHVAERVAPDRQRWIVGAGERTVEISVTTADDEPGRRFEWIVGSGTPYGAQVSVTLEPLLARGGTVVRIGLAATGPGVQAVSAVARLFGGSVAQIARESLRDFKALAEAGEIPKAVRN